MDVLSLKLIFRCCGGLIVDPLVHVCNNVCVWTQNRSPLSCVLDFAVFLLRQCWSVARPWHIIVSSDHW